MKKPLLLLSLLCPLLALAQVDVQVQARNQIFDIQRGAVWGTSGINGTTVGFNNNFIVSLPSNSITSPGVCVYFSNHDVSADSMTPPLVYGTADPKLSKFTGATTPWVQLRYVQFPGNSSLNSIGATSTAAMYINAAGMAKIALQLSGGVGTGTVDIYASQATCGGITLGTASGNVVGEAFPLIQCDQAATASIAVGATTAVAAGIANTRPYICHIEISTTTTFTTVGLINLQSSTSTASCTGVLTVASWEPNTTAGAANPITIGANIGYAYGGLSFPTGSAICFNNSGATAGAVQVSISYTNL